VSEGRSRDERIGQERSAFHFEELAEASVPEFEGRVGAQYLDGLQWDAVQVEMDGEFGDSTDAIVEDVHDEAPGLSVGAKRHHGTDDHASGGVNTDEGPLLFPADGLQEVVGLTSDEFCEGEFLDLGIVGGGSGCEQSPTTG